MYQDFRVDGRRCPVTTARRTARLSWRRLNEVARQSEVRIAVSEQDLFAGEGLLIEAGEGNFVDIELDDTPNQPIVWSVACDWPNQRSPLQKFWTVPRELGEWITSAAFEDHAFRSAAHEFSTRFLATADTVDVLLHIATPGVVSVVVNGKRLPRRLGPGYAAFGHEIPAMSLDITPYVTRGENRIIVELASGISWTESIPGRYSKLRSELVPPRLSAVVHGHGTRGLAVLDQSGPHWQTRPSRTTGTHWYGGEDYNATIPYAPWTPAFVLSTHHSLWWPEHPPIEVVDELQGQVAFGSPQRMIFDFGTNQVGSPRIAVAALPEGVERVTIRPSELLNEDGSDVDQWSTGSPIFHTFAPSQDQTEWSPRFSYNGYRYVAIEPAIPGIQVVAETMRVSNDAVSRFHCDHGVLQPLDAMIRRAVEGNMYSMFTDCPHREKLGWLEQLHLCFEAIVRNFNVEAHLRDALHHVRVAQMPNGAIPNIAPEFADFSGAEYRGDPNAFREDPNWGSAIVLTTEMHYRHYGDPRVLEENWTAITRYLDYLGTRAHDGLLDFGLGDWIALDHDTPRELVASHGYVRALRSASRIASTLGRDDDRIRYARYAEQSAERLLSRYPVGPGSTQAHLALVSSLEDSRGRAKCASWLAERWVLDGNRLTVGENALGPLIDLVEFGDLDRAFLDIISRPDVPGYGLQVASGATALTETWTMRGGEEGEGSQNHFMLGMIDHWIRGRVGGLRQAPASVAWRQFEFAPQMSIGVAGASETLVTVRGEFRVEWHVDGEVVLSIPAGTSGRIHLPPEWNHVRTGTDMQLNEVVPGAFTVTAGGPRTFRFRLA